MRPLSPLRIFPGVAVKRSQMLSPRPSSSVAPSTWYADTAAPHTKLPELPFAIVIVYPPDC